ncbi:MAG: DUF4386 domain-containing protein, partial [Micrococcales bacterium]|nr:DUF4386 domain-containing protein [Micrococcales bacterium]
VSSSQLQLRVAIGLLTVNTVADLVVFWGLYYFLRPAGRALSLLALLFGVAHTVVMTGAVTNLTNLLHMASSDLPAEAFAAQVATETDAFAWAWQAGMVMFGVHLLLRGWLLFAAGYMKKVLGIVMWVVAAGYLVDGFGQILVAGYTGSNPVGWLEVALPVWLIWFVVTSRRPALVTTRPDAGP